MRSFVFSREAEQDLTEILDYVARDKPDAALRLKRRIELAVAKLVELPGIGHRRRDVPNSRYLFFSVRPYVLAYRFDESAVTVVRVIHGARDIRRQLGE